MEREFATKTCTTPSEDDYGCGWSVTNLLSGLYAESAMREEDLVHSDPLPQPVAPPLIYRVA